MFSLHGSMDSVFLKVILDLVMLLKNKTFISTDLFTIYFYEMLYYNIKQSVIRISNDNYTYTQNL